MPTTGTINKHIKHDKIAAFYYSRISVAFGVGSSTIEKNVKQNIRLYYFKIFSIRSSILKHIIQTRPNHCLLLT